MDLPPLSSLTMPKFLHPVRCAQCGEHWWVRVGTEFWPQHCCYCGVKFTWTTDEDGKAFQMSGQPIETGGTDACTDQA